MSDADSLPKFGRRERFARARRMFALGLVSTFILEYEVFAVMLVPSAAHRSSSGLDVLELLLSLPLKGIFWFYYAILGLPVALAHALGSLTWAREVDALAAHITLTLVACVAIASVWDADPLFSYIFTIVIVGLGHLFCIAKNPPQQEAASRSAGPSDVGTS